MKAVVDKDTCIGCGLCPSVSPEVFQMDDEGKAEAIAETVPSGAEDSASEAADSCPVNAISVE
ncbi:ferredoxin [Clostridium sp. DJ247]|uniref:ferredoxin n=1 Tax=Clostridium sp. DJ247 TaxID=2726188 RepID=UPI0016250F9D|nr:ferredoxin [Clostridium sp. DJ247]MBC2581278.1 ferredoxin [Clostridium sp. DJ247]